MSDRKAITGHERTLAARRARTDAKHVKWAIELIEAGWSINAPSRLREDELITRELNMAQARADEAELVSALLEG